MSENGNEKRLKETEIETNSVEGKRRNGLKMGLEEMMI